MEISCLPQGGRLCHRQFNATLYTNTLYSTEERRLRPIEYRNIFIKELEPGAVDGEAQPRANAAANRKPLNSPHAELLARIDDSDLPKGYGPVKHQQYVDRRIAELNEEQRTRIGQLWKEKQKIDPDMPNRGASFVKILQYVAENVK